MRVSPAQRTRLRVLSVSVVGVLPAALLLFDALTNRLGAEPVEEITHRTGEWALRMLVLCLSVTPLRRLTGWGWLASLRRTFGLLAFLYASLHLATFFYFELETRLAKLAEEVVERPYITVGFLAFALMVPLAATSTRKWQKRLGHRWVRLHRAVYVIAVLAVVHFLWLVKADLREPLVYAAVVFALLGFRLYWKFLRNRPEYATLPRSL